MKKLDGKHIAISFLLILALTLSSGCAYIDIPTPVPNIPAEPAPAPDAGRGAEGLKQDIDTKVLGQIRTMGLGSLSWIAKCCGLDAIEVLAALKRHAAKGRVAKVREDTKYEKKGWWKALPFCCWKD